MISHIIDRYLNDEYEDKGDVDHYKDNPEENVICEDANHFKDESHSNDSEDNMCSVGHITVTELINLRNGNS